MIKIKRKVIFSSLLSLFLLSFFVLTASAVSLKYDCTVGSIECKGVIVTDYGTSYEYSDSVYATSGKILGISNNSTGPFNLVTQLVDSSNNAISPEIAFTDTQYIKAPKSGYYKVKVTCKDASASKRCKGNGSVSQ